jgi:hypothetical protein
MISPDTQVSNGLIMPRFDPVGIIRTLALHDAEKGRRFNWDCYDA